MKFSNLFAIINYYTVPNAFSGFFSSSKTCPLNEQCPLTEELLLNEELKDFAYSLYIVVDDNFYFGLRSIFDRNFNFRNRSVPHLVDL